jgi:hypothetical protein
MRLRNPALALVLCGILGLFVLVATVTARTAHVYSTEAWFADPAYHLVRDGCLCTTIIESRGFWLAGAERHTYWILPLHALVQSVWYRLFGFSLWSLRALSEAAGALLLAAMFVIVRRLADSRSAVLAVLLLAVDWRVLQTSAVGRMDILCAALGASAIAAYVMMRDRQPVAAVLTGNTLLAAACCTHPCGVLWIPALAVMMWRGKMPRERVRQFAIAAVPYLIAAGLYGAYVWQAPQDFLSQIAGNTSGFAGELGGTRFHSLTAPLSGLVEEWRGRYRPVFGGAWRLQYLVAFLYLAAVSFSERARGLWMMAVFPAVLLWLLDGTRQPFYLIHVVPGAAACTAVWLCDQVRRSYRGVLTVGITGLLGIQLATVAAQVHENAFAHEYRPALAFLKSHSKPGDLVMGDAGLAFGLGFDSGLVDDLRLGYYSGRKPQFIAMNDFDRRWVERRRLDDPQLYHYVRDTLTTKYREVFENSAYTIWVWREAGSATGASKGGSFTKGLANK